MPHIFSSGCDNDKIIQQINIHTEVVFRQDYFQANEHTKCRQKLKELQVKLDRVVEEYFSDYAANEPMSNHEYNLMKTNH